MKWHKQKRKLKDLIAADYNPRKMTTQERRDLENSIDEFGTILPLVINTGSRENVLIGGHQRTKVYQERGIKEVDVLVPTEELSQEDEKRLNLRLNKNTGSWDMEKLKEMSVDLLLDVGFGDEELEMMFDNVELLDDSYRQAKDQEEEPKTKTGDVIQLGKHILVCGEPTKENKEKAFQGRTADLMYTEPGHRQKEISKALDAPTKQDSHYFIWTKEQAIRKTWQVMEDHDITVKNLCLWLKPTIKKKGTFAEVYQPCVYGTKGNPKVSERVATTGILNQGIQDNNHMHEDFLQEINIWLHKPDPEDRFEFKYKPVSILEKVLKRTTAPGDIVYDPYAKTGSTLIACETLKRVAITMEEDPKLCDVIVERYQQKTKQDPIWLSTN